MTDIVKLASKVKLSEITETIGWVIEQITKVDKRYDKSEVNQHEILHEIYFGYWQN